jgi:outer membrane protein OmpA-like peptidoglycan-associated protein
VTDSPGTDSGPADASPNPSSEPDDFERLRRLILVAERDRLSNLERRLDDPAVRAGELSGILDGALAASIKKNRRQVAEALSPAMGPAIRRAIAETLRTVVDSFNQVLTHSLSARALQWRVESWRTGKPFAEVVLSHSLVYRVEQVFLVHRATGLLLQDIAIDPASAQDSDLVSGMLTAIQDFVRDSFSVEADQAVDTMRVGDLAVLVEQAEHAYVAAVVRGSPPTGLRAVLRDALEAIQVELAEAFDTFSGDSTPLDDARRHLEGCLQMQVAARSTRRRWLAPAVAGGGVLLLLAAWFGLSLRAGWRWNGYLARLGREPGILVVSERGGVWRSSIAGFADPYAADPARLLVESGLDPARVSSRWERVISQEPSIVVARARAVLQAPQSVNLALANGTLKAIGSAPHGWAESAGGRAATIPGVVRFDSSHLTDEGLAAVELARTRLESLVLRFDVGSAEFSRGEIAKIDEVAAAMTDLAAASRDGDVAVKIDLIGHSDGTGSEGNNMRLSRARADRVRTALEARGLRRFVLATQGVGASQPLRSERTDDDRTFNRSVTFRVVRQP